MYSAHWQSVCELILAAIDDCVLLAAENLLKLRLQWGKMWKKILDEHPHPSSDKRPNFDDVSRMSKTEQQHALFRVRYSISFNFHNLDSSVFAHIRSLLGVPS